MASDIYSVLDALHRFGVARDSVGVVASLKAVMLRAPDIQAGVWEALHVHRDDVDAKFILDHVDISRDDEDTWIVSLKGTF